MGIASSGRVSINEIATEYGGAPPHYISEYYGKGGVTGSGVIKVSDFHGTSARELPSKVWGYISANEDSEAFDYYSAAWSYYGNNQGNGSDVCDIDCNFSSISGGNEIHYYTAGRDTHLVYKIRLMNNGTVSFNKINTSSKDLYQAGYTTTYNHTFSAYPHSSSNGIDGGGNIVSIDKDTLLLRLTCVGYIQNSSYLIIENAFGTCNKSGVGSFNIASGGTAHVGATTSAPNPVYLMDKEISAASPIRLSWAQKLSTSETRIGATGYSGGYSTTAGASSTYHKSWSQGKKFLLGGTGYGVHVFGGNGYASLSSVKMHDFNNSSPEGWLYRGENHSNSMGVYLTQPGDIIPFTVGFLSPTEFFCLAENSYVHLSRGYFNGSGWYFDTIGRFNDGMSNSFGTSIISSPRINPMGGTISDDLLMLLSSAGGYDQKIIFFKLNSGHSHPTYLGESETFKARYGGKLMSGKCNETGKTYVVYHATACNQFSGETSINGSPMNQTKPYIVVLAPPVS